MFVVIPLSQSFDLGSIDRSHSNCLIIPWIATPCSASSTRVAPSRLIFSAPPICGHVGSSAENSFFYPSLASRRLQHLETSNTNHSLRSAAHTTLPHPYKTATSSWRNHSFQRPRQRDGKTGRAPRREGLWRRRCWWFCWWLCWWGGR